MTSDELEGLARLEREVTPGPWLWRDGIKEIVAVIPNECDWDGDEPFIDEAIVETDGGYYGPKESDRNLILALRNHAAELIRMARESLSAEEESQRLVGDYTAIVDELALRNKENATLRARLAEVTSLVADVRERI